MKRLIIIVVVVIVVAGGAYAAYSMGYLPANLVPGTASAPSEGAAAPAEQGTQADESQSAIDEPIALALSLIHI